VGVADATVGLQMDERAPVLGYQELVFEAALYEVLYPLDALGV
jgi:hypothetical protein